MGNSSNNDNGPEGTTESLQKEQNSLDAATPEVEVEGHTPEPADPAPGITWDVLPSTEHSINASWDSVSLSELLAFVEGHSRIRVWQAHRRLGMLRVKHEEFFPVVAREQSMVITRWANGTDGILPAGELFHVALEYAPRHWISSPCDSPIIYEQIGEAKQVFTLAATPIPSPPVFSAISASFPTTLTWEERGDSESLIYEVWYWQSSDLVSHKTETSATGAEPMQIRIKTARSVQYKFRAWCRRSGDPRWSKQYAEEDQTINCLAPICLEAHTVSDVSATVKWTFGDGAATTHDRLYQIWSGEPDIEFEDRLLDAPQYTVEDLKRESPYLFQIRYCCPQLNPDLWSSWSDEIELTTRASLLSLLARTDKQPTQTDDSIEFEVTQAEFEVTHADFVFFLLRYRAPSWRSWSEVRQEGGFDAAGKACLKLDGLDSGTEVTVQVKYGYAAATGSMETQPQIWSDWSEEMNFKTTGNPPPSVLHQVNETLLGLAQNKALRGGLAVAGSVGSFVPWVGLMAKGLTHLLKFSQNTNTAVKMLKNGEARDIIHQFAENEFVPEHIRDGALRLHDAVLAGAGIEVEQELKQFTKAVAGDQQLHEGLARAQSSAGSAEERRAASDMLQGLRRVDGIVNNDKGARAEQDDGSSGKVHAALQSDLQRIEMRSFWEALMQVQEAAVLMEEWGVDTADDLQVLDEEDLIRLADYLKKKVMKKKFIRATLGSAAADGDDKEKAEEEV